jgi:thioredoxin-related protein
MNKILLLLCLTILAFGSDYKDFAQKMGYETSYKQALERAKEEDKDVMVLTISNFCPWCSKLEKRVLSKDEVDTIVKAKFIPVILNKEEKKLPHNYAAPIVPTLYLVKPKKEEVYDTQVGYLNKVDMIKFIAKP